MKIPDFTGSTEVWTLERHHSLVRELHDVTHPRGDQFLPNGSLPLTYLNRRRFLWQHDAHTVMPSYHEPIAVLEYMFQLPRGLAGAFHQVRSRDWVPVNTQIHCWHTNNTGPPYVNNPIDIFTIVGTGEAWESAAYNTAIAADRIIHVACEDGPTGPAPGTIRNYDYRVTLSFAVDFRAIY